MAVDLKHLEKQRDYYDATDTVSYGTRLCIYFDQIQHTTQTFKNRTEGLQNRGENSPFPKFGRFP